MQNTLTRDKIDLKTDILFSFRLYLFMTQFFGRSVELAMTIVPIRAPFKDQYHPIFAKFSAFEAKQGSGSAIADCQVTALLVALLLSGLRQLHPVAVAKIQLLILIN